MSARLRSLAVLPGVAVLVACALGLRFYFAVTLVERLVMPRTAGGTSS